MQFKRGATFDAIFTASNVVVGGVAVTDLTGWTARCQLRTSGDALIEELTATIIDVIARKVRLVSAGTSAWPKGKAVGDIVFKGPGGTPTVPSDSFSFDVVDGPTR